MRKHGRIFAVNIVLGISLFLIVVFDVLIIAAYSAYKEENRGMQEETEPYNVYEIISMEGTSAQCLGRTWQQLSAEEGYQYYLVDVKVKNQGTSAASYVSLWFSGENYDEVSEIDMDSQQDETSDLKYYDRQIIPAGQSGIIKVLLKVKDGVHSVEMNFTNSYGEEEVYEVTI